MSSISEILQVISDPIKRGEDVIKSISGVYDAVESTYKKFDGSNEFKGRNRSLELIIINATKHNLIWSDSYFDSGATFWGPTPLNIEPTGNSLWAVANRSGAMTGVAGGGKWMIEGTDLAFMIGFTHPLMGSYKNTVGIRSKDQSPNWGYDNCRDDRPKQFNESGFCVTVRMEEAKISHYRRFVYCITEA